MSKQTVASAHERIDGIEPRVVKLEAELSTLQRSVQRVENILIGTAASVIGLLFTILMRMLFILLQRLQVQLLPLIL